MIGITITLAGTYLYLQFDDNFDPIYTEQLKVEGKNVLDLTVDRHLKTGIDDFKLHIGESTTLGDNIKRVENLDVNQDHKEVVDLSVETNLDDGTKHYKLHLSEDIKSVDNDTIKKQEDLARYTEGIKNFTCEELTQLINRDDIKPDYKQVTEAEFSSRC